MIADVKITNGDKGAEYINDTDDHTGVWSAVQCTEDTVFATNTVCNIANFSALVTDATVFSQGQILFGRFTTIDLVSGAVIAYIA